MTSKLFFTCAVVALLLVPAVIAQDKVEQYGGNAVVGDGNYDSWFYAPSVTLNPSNTHVFMFLQGKDVGQNTGDAIMLYTTPNTTQGVMSPYSKHSIILGQPDFHYSSPSVSRAGALASGSRCNGGAEYYMTVGTSPDARNFEEHLFGDSCNGEQWNWKRLAKWVPGGSARSVHIPGVTLRWIKIGGVDYLVGFMEFFLRNASGASEGGGIGLMRARRDRYAAGGIDLVEIYSNGQWRAVNADGTYSFEPSVIVFGVQPKFDENGELFYSYHVPFPGGCGCDPLPTQWSNAIHYRKVTVDINNTAAIPTLSQAYNISSNVRCMPGYYSNSRMYPVRLPWTDLMYSATHDHRRHLHDGSPYPPSCEDPHANFGGTTIVVTGIQ
jgi:hypothetical protein